MKILLIILGICVYILIGISYIAKTIYENPKKKTSPIETLFYIILWPVLIIIYFINKGLKKK